MDVMSLRRFSRSNDGVAAVQFAMVAAPLLGLLYAALQIFLLFFAQQNLETAAEAAARLILTGNAQKNGVSQTSFKTAVCQQVSALLDCSKVMVDVQVASSFSGANINAPTITYDAQGKVTNTWNYDLGSAGSIVVMRLAYLWPMFNLPGLTLVNQQNGNHLMMATAVFKNEAYN